MQPVTVTLSSGREIVLREPMAGDLRGVKLLDLLQLDVSAAASVVERVSELSAVEMYALSGADAVAVMTGLVGFFAPALADQSASQIASSPPGK